MKLVQQTQIGARLDFILIANEGQGWTQRTIKSVNLTKVLWLLLLLINNVKGYILLVEEEVYQIIGSIVQTGNVLLVILGITGRAVAWGIR